MLTLLAAMVATACGDDDGGSDGDTAAIAALRQQITEAQASDAAAGDTAFTDEEILCMAEGIVGEFGAARVIEADDQEFSEFMSEATPEERRAVVDLTLGCVDLTAQFIGPLVAEGVSEESATCIGDSLMENETFRDVLAEGLASGSFEPGPGAEAQLMEALMPVMFDCMSAEELGQLGGG
jgi:hypothetical protein